MTTLAKITERCIEDCRHRFEAGDKTALLDAIDFCARSATVMPVWLAEAYCAAYTEWDTYGVRSLDEAFGVEGGWVDTVHAYTNDQQLLDLPHHDLRRSRAAGQNIIPTGTGADGALAKVLPHLKDKVHSVAVRVPVPDGSMSNVVGMLRSQATTEQVRDAFIQASLSDRWSGIVGVSDMPMVSAMAVMVLAVPMVMQVP